jgi:hypothetical protein
MRSIYLLQPFHVGSKNAKSTALVVPCAVVKEYNIDRSTIFMLQTDNQKKTITLEVMQYSSEKKQDNAMMPDKESPQTSIRQASLQIH